jgi:hypothetical protein
MQNDIHSERNRLRTLVAGLAGMAGLGLAACGGGGGGCGGANESGLLTNADLIGELDSPQAATSFPACNTTGGVNSAQFSTRFTQYFEYVMGKSGKNGSVYKDLTDTFYAGTTKYAVCIDKAAYTYNDGTGNTYSNTAKSEGQGYGMVLCAAYGDRTKFDRLWNYTYKYMRITSGVQAEFFNFWSAPDSKAKVIGANIAPDGEVWIVAGLLMAWKIWGDNKYRDAADAILGALKREYTPIQRRRGARMV